MDKSVDSGEKPAPSIKEAECLTGQHLGNGAALQTPAGEPHFAVARFGGDTILSIDAKGDHKAIEMDSKPLGGLYRAGQSRLLALEFGGDRLFRLTFKEGHIAPDAHAEVCKTPRLAEINPTHAFVLCRDPKRRLARVDLDSLEVAQIAFPGSTPADLALTADGAWLYVANLASNDLTPIDTNTLSPSERIPVDPEPFRLVPIPGPTGRMGLLHANTPLITLIDTDKRAVLMSAKQAHTPTRAAADPSGTALFTLSSGSGKLTALDTATLEAIHTIDVPIGASELVWSPTKTGPGKLLISTADAGELWIIAWEDKKMSIETKAHLGASAGRISASPVPGQVWLTGPKAGRVARYRVD